MIFVFVRLTSLSMIISRSIHVAANGNISLFLVGCCLWGYTVRHDWSDLATAAAGDIWKRVISLVPSFSHVQLPVTPRTTAHQASLSITNSWSLLKLMSIESVMPSNHLIFCHPLLFPPSILPRIRVFSNESVLHIRWPKGWSLASVLPVNSQDWFPLGLTGLISCSPRDCQASPPF